MYRFVQHAEHFTTCTFHTRGLEDGQCHNRDPIMENLDNRISVNRDVIPPGSLPTGDPEWAFVSTPRHGKFIRAKNARIPCGAVRSSRVSIAGSEIDRSVDLSEWKICFLPRLSEIGGLSQLARSRTIRLYFQQDDSISSNLGKLGERWERRGKVEGLRASLPWDGS